MPFAYRTGQGPKLFSLTGGPAGATKEIDVNLLWDIGFLGSRERPTLNYEFNKTVRVKVK